MYRIATLLSYTFLFGSVALAEEHIVDDQHGSPGFSTTGNDWTTWGTNGYGYSGSDSSYHYLSHTVGGSDRRGTATWRADLGQTGTWRIDTWFRRTENRTRDADHVLIDSRGDEIHVVVDQHGEGASGWVELGEMWCEAGFGRCMVTLDGTDDDGSDAANAMRFTFVSAEGGSTESGPCDAPNGSGTYTMERYAGSVSATDWESVSYATGEADGREAFSPNVDAGEVLKATGFDVCDPDGEERIDSVVLAVNARTQYESGTYALNLRLDGEGAASRVFTGTSSRWHEVDLSADRLWTWGELETLRARVSLNDHPGGARDSDAWVDSFRLRVVYTGSSDEQDDTGDPPDSEPGEGPDGDTGQFSSEDTGSGPNAPSPPGQFGCACQSSGRSLPSGLPVLLLVLLVLVRRRRPGTCVGHPVLTI
jgi:uncharacterized protein (TIGR03382 family)